MIGLSRSNSSGAYSARHGLSPIPGLVIMPLVPFVSLCPSPPHVLLQVQHVSVSVPHRGIVLLTRWSPGKLVELGVPLLVRCPNPLTAIPPVCATLWRQHIKPLLTPLVGGLSLATIMVP